MLRRPARLRSIRPADRNLGKLPVMVYYRGGIAVLGGVVDTQWIPDLPARHLNYSAR
jgi:acetyl esterase/lipase